MRPYDVIFFDLDHTLVDTRGQYLRGLALALQALYGDSAPSGFAKRFMQVHDTLWPRYDRREISMPELRRLRFTETWAHYGVHRTPAEADEFQAVYDATFESTLTAFPGVVEMLNQVAVSHRLGIITNGAPDLQWRKLGIAGLQPYFPAHSVVISEQIGLAKPHPSVYQAACDAMQAAPAECLMIGDNHAADVQGARSFGIDALWLVPDPQEPVAELQRLFGEQPVVHVQDVVDRVRVLEQARQV